jgi:hypothetical protein
MKETIRVNIACDGAHTVVHQALVRLPRQGANTRFFDGERPVGMVGDKHKPTAG